MRWHGIGPGTVAANETHLEPLYPRALFKRSWLFYPLFGYDFRPTAEPFEDAYDAGTDPSVRLEVTDGATGSPGALDAAHTHASQGIER